MNIEYKIVEAVEHMMQSSTVNKKKQVYVKSIYLPMSFMLYTVLYNFVKNYGT